MEWVISVSVLSGGNIVEYCLLRCAWRGEPDPEMMQQSRKESLVRLVSSGRFTSGFGRMTSCVLGGALVSWLMHPVTQHK